MGPAYYELEINLPDHAWENAIPHTRKQWMVVGGSFSIDEVLRQQQLWEEDGYATRIVKGMKEIITTVRK